MKNLIKLFLLGSLLISGCTTIKLPQSGADYAKTSAMITLDDKMSGGSGVILKSTAMSSLILTNKHVCQLIQVGGTVHTDQGSYPVYSFRVYKKHDLCLIQVLTNLHEDTKLAEEAPASYTDATIAGHPALLPTMITRGHFANHMGIQLMVDTQECDGTEEGQDALMCAFTGVKPVLQKYEAQPVTATIMAGSSGSGVFNSKGEVAGLVFAGSEGLSYGYIVPFEYVRDFLRHIQDYPEQYPDSKSKPKSFFKSLNALKTICKREPKACKGIALQGIYNE